MVSNEFYVEKLLCKDAAKIVIDEEYKRDLKNRIMFGDKDNNITELPKRKNNFKQSKYFKIASGFVICVFVSGTIFKAVDAPSKSIFGKGEEKVFVPISSSEKSMEDINGKNFFRQAKDALVKDDNGNELLNIAKVSKGNAVDDILQKYSKKNNVVINKNPSKVSPEDSDADINKSLVKVKENASVAIDVGGPINVPKPENKEEVVSNLKFYDSRYSVGGKSLVSVKDGGIYIKDIQSAKEKKLIAYNEETEIVEKPNFTPNDGIIYYKSEKVTAENGVIGEKNGAIYLWDKNEQESSKLVDGKNPMISKDGKKLVYESESKIFILTLATNNKSFVDNGKYPAFSEDGNIISYVKQGISSLWVFDLITENTHRLINKGVNINDDNIQSWADAVRGGSIISDLNVISKYSYYESIWSSNNKEIYVIRKDNAAEIFEFIKFNLDK